MKLSIATIALYIVIIPNMYSQSPPTDLQVTGVLDVAGSTISLGSLTGDSATPGVVEMFSESNPSGSYQGIVSWDMNRSNSTWLWRRLNAAGTDYVPSMQISSLSALTLFGPTDPAVMAAAVILAPESGASQIPGSLTILGSSFTSNATANTLPNQALSDAASIVTRSLGDTRYLTRSSPSFVFGSSSSAPVAGSVAVGTNALASGTVASPALALGQGAQAYTSSTVGSNSTYYGGIAIGNGAEAGGLVGGTLEVGGGIAIGSLAISRRSGTAIGINAVSADYAAIAIGEESQANGQRSVALGYQNAVSGFGTHAFGSELTSSGWRTTVLGYRNEIPSGEQASTRLDDGYALLVGNGSDTTHGTADYRSNALTVKWNGDGWLQGNFTTAKGLTVTQNATIDGNATVVGTIEGAKASFSDTVRIAPRGGLSMGEFTYDPAGN